MLVKSIISLLQFTNTWLLIVPAYINIVEIICSTPGEGTNTKPITYANGDSITTFKYPEAVTYFCKNKFTPRKGDNFCVQCLANGNLSGPPPTCEREL